MRVKSQKDFFSGLLYLLAGLIFMWGATRYEMGTAAHMGPGYFPMLLGILMALLGSAIAVKSLLTSTDEAGDKIGPWAWRPLFFIIAANFAFGVLLGGLPSIRLPAMGLIVGIFALTFIASLASKEFKFKEVAVLATVLATASYLGFILLLKLQFQVWPDFIPR